MEQINKPLYKKKLFYLPVFAILLIASAFALGVYIASVPTTVTVTEAVSVSTVSLSVGAFPGETITKDITIDNAASVSQDVTLAWVENSNPSLVDYTTDLPKTVTVAPGANTITVSFSVAHDSAVGTFDGDVEVSRV